MHKRNTLLYGIFISGVFLYIDQGLKWMSLHSWDSAVVFGRWFGWYPFMNNGVAFGLPVPIALVSAVTVPLIGVMLWLLVQAYRRGTPSALVQMCGLLAVIVGAGSNLADRLQYQKTVDYILLGTAVINIADILIILGFILLFWSMREVSPRA